MVYRRILQNNKGVKNMEKLLQKVSANPENPNWENIIKRQNSLYKRDND